MEEEMKQDKPLTDDELLQKLKDTQNKLDELTSKYQKLFLSQTTEIKKEEHKEEIPQNISKEMWESLGEKLQEQLLELNDMEE